MIYAIILLFTFYLYKKGFFTEIMDACKLSDVQPAASKSPARRPAPVPVYYTPAEPVQMSPPAPVNPAPAAPLYGLSREQLEGAAVATLRQKGYKKAVQICGSVGDDVLRDIIQDKY